MEFQKKFASGVSIVSNAVIILLKLIVGHISGSISIISEAIHSLSDFLASILTFFAVNRSCEPADKEHPFGHGKYEDMSGFIEGGLIIFAGFFIIYEAAKKLFIGQITEHETIWGIYVMSFSVFANICVSSYLFNIAKKSQSVALKADAEHLKTDIFSSLGVLIGLLLIKITGLSIIDPIIAIIVASIILKTGFSISKEALNDLLDGALPNEDINIIKDILNKNTVIKGYKNLKGRKSGPYKEIELTILFNPDMKISCSHNICDQIENEIKSKLKNTAIIIHSEPLFDSRQKS